MTTGARRLGKPGLAVLVIVLAVTAGVLAFGLNAYREHRSAHDDVPPVARAPLSQVEAVPRLAFRSTAPGPDYGKVALVPLAAPDGARAFTDVACDRVDVAAGHVACLRTVRGVVTTFEAELLDASWTPVMSWALPGIPSRTRLSEDGSLIATTTFVSGHSYAAAGFSTHTGIVSADGNQYGNIEEFLLLVDGSPYTAIDRNMWGVTFTGETTFYATAASATAGTTWLVTGDLEARTLTAVRENAECPSVSPDGNKIAYKKDRGDRQWELAVLDLVTGEERVLAESRSVDDQVEWLDDETLLYGLPRPHEPGVTDIWSIGVTGTAEPELFLPQAWSPAVWR